MAWRPIAVSGIPFVFNDTFGTVSMAGSTVTAPMNSGPAWYIMIGDETVDYPIRITVQSYSSEQQFIEDPSNFSFEVVGGGITTVINENTGNTTEFSPNPVTGTGHYVDYIPGNGVETVRTEAYSMLVELDVVASGGCQEHGRTTRAFVSGYTLDRVHVVRAARTQRRCLVADFNGAIDKSRQIAKATWRCNSPWITILDTPTISASGRAAQVNATLGNCGAGHVKCSVELDNGEIYTQVFEVRVVDAPYFAEPYQSPGPYELTVTA
ncbi:hypothetical protein [Lysobacter antibioticus]|uniref:Uncharacterized protein n=1 Tax=Lysobacter antibioticus TaxID=84531 RepID=A0A0S2F7I2_LYSAN|nr:hypothetical protein [Lysobacter antibioticus]ALN79498.1 hypothetical protein LA76x_1341 [Lysobacter antibioticus]